MKRALKDKSAFTMICFVLLLLFSCRDKAHQDDTNSATKYTCPMHPQIIADKPGTCPICHMELVPLNAAASHNVADTSLESLVKPTNQLVLSEIRTVKPSEGVRTADVRIQGIINYDSNNRNVISSRVGGRIERLYVKYNYQSVSKGQKLMDIYSPDLANAQQELLYLKNSGDKNLLDAAKMKLRLLGASDQQINTLLRTGKLDYTFSVYSPYSGYVSEQSGAVAAETAYSSGTVITESSGSSMGEMGGNSASVASKLPTVKTNSPLQLREGQYISQGQKIFDLIKASSVWAEFFASAEQLNYLKRETPVQVTALDNPAQSTLSKISLIQPYYSEGATFSLVRSKVNNPGKQWKVGQLVEVKTDVDSKFGSWLPRSSVLHLGSKYVAFVKNEGHFVPVYVRITERRGEWVEIGESLPKDANVAVNAWFLVDSEIFVKLDSLKM